MIRTLVVLVTIAACGGAAAKPAAPIANTGTGSATPPRADEPAPKRNIADEAFARYTEWTKQMCACAAGDQACASAIVDAQVKWGEELAKAGEHGGTIDPQETERMAARLQPILLELGKCMMRAMNPPVSLLPPATP